MIVVLFGPPGSGKGTQSAFISQAFGLPHVSTGEMLRTAAAAGSRLGDEVAPLMASGTLIPDELIVRVVEERLGRADARDGVVLDGFPRTVAQARALDTILVSARRRVDLIISLIVPPDDLVERLLVRGREQGRLDDTPTVIRERMVEYQRKTIPVVKHYSSLGARIAHVDGLGAVEEVRSRIHSQVATAAHDAASVQLSGRAFRPSHAAGRTES